MDGHAWRWWTIRVELAIAIAAPILIALVAFVCPVAPEPMFLGGGMSGIPWGAANLGGFALSLIGAAWAWRIWRADLEAGTPPWRYRARR